jgi:uncharacterized SAM-binding protein YcdF (DUF218 family)
VTPALDLARWVPPLLLPIGLTLVVAAVGLLLRRRWLVAAALTWLWLASTPLLAGALARYVQGDLVRGVAADAPTADAIVVLSAGRSVAPGPAAVVEWTGTHRFLGGLELLRAERAPLLLFTGGWSPRAPETPLEGATLIELAHQLGVPVELMETTGPVQNTPDEAAAVAALLRERGVGGAAPHVLLVTSAFHVARAVALFERQGLRVTPFPVDFRGGAARRGGPAALLPQASALSTTETMLRELMGRVVDRWVER